MWHVAIIGAGAIGSPLAFGLSQRPESGEVTIIDGDQVQLSNLARQPWYDAQDVGQGKAALLARRLQPDVAPVRVQAVPRMLTEDNVDGLLSSADLVMDATDNWETRLIIQDWAARHHRPWIFNSAVRLEGMSTCLAPGGPCLKCWFGATTSQGPRCFEAGVLGSVTLAVAGQALRLFDQWLKDPGQPSALWLVDGLAGKFRAINPGSLRCHHYGIG